jgi:predicted aconitase with swiveling domain
MGEWEIGRMGEKGKGTMKLIGRILKLPSSEGSGVGYFR